MASGNRIRVTHAGALPRSPELAKLVWGKGNGAPHDEAELERLLDNELAQTIRRQVEIGIDSINDGELSKTSFTQYCANRISGFEAHPFDASRDPAPLSIGARDIVKFREYFANGHAKFVTLDPPKTTYICTGPLRYVGHAELQADLQRFKNAPASITPRLMCRRTRPARSSIGCAINITPAKRNSSKRSPIRCAKNIKRSSMLASACRSTIRTCRTAG
jgi:5-methyltetrahydropteroyltriglutamate--homocysteine methyltransferase